MKEVPAAATGNGERDDPAAGDDGAAVDGGGGAVRTLGGGMVAADDPPRAVEQGEVARIVAVAFPAGQRQALGLAKAQWRVDLVDRDGEVDVALDRAAGLVADEAPFAGDRAFAPRDDHAFGGGEVVGDRFAPFVTGTDMRVPPHGETIGGERVDQRSHPRAILGLVGNEHVGHWPPPSRCLAGPRAAMKP